MTNGLIFLAFLFGVPLLIYWLFFGRKKSENTGVTYYCTRCERQYVTPDIPLNSRCKSCGGGVQPR